MPTRSLLVLAVMAALNAAPAWAIKLQPPVGEVLVVSGVRLSDYEGPGRAVALQSLSRSIYAAYKDEADFLLLIANRRTIPARTSVDGYHLRVSNQVRGLGAPIFNDGAQFGGTQRLKAILYFPRWTSFWNMPVLHELAHQWGNEALNTSERGHFGFCGAGSQLGGFDPGTLQAKGNGLYQARNSAGRFFGTAANGANSVPYSPFELYLMGLAEAKEVNPFPCAVQPTWVSLREGTFRAQGMHWLTMAEIIKRIGPRVPPYAASQKVFRVLVVFLSESEPTTAEVSGVRQAAKRLVQVGDNGDSTYSFFEATRGRGRLELVKPSQVQRSRVQSSQVQSSRVQRQN